MCGVTVRIGVNGMGLSHCASASYRVRELAVLLQVRTSHTSIKVTQSLKGNWSSVNNEIFTIITYCEPKCRFATNTTDIISEVLRSTAGNKVTRIFGRIHCYNKRQSELYISLLFYPFYWMLRFVTSIELFYISL